MLDFLFGQKMIMVLSAHKTMACSAGLICHFDYSM